MKYIRKTIKSAKGEGEIVKANKAPIWTEINGKLTSKDSFSPGNLFS